MSTVESIARPRRNGERRRAPTASISKESPAITGVVDRKSGSAGMPRPSSYAVFCLKKKNKSALVECVDGLASGRAGGGDQTLFHLRRMRFGLPGRDLLPPLERYARLVVDGGDRLVGY